MKKGRRSWFPSIGREGRISTVRKLFILWRLVGSLLNRYRRRARGPAAGDVLLLTYFLHIGGGLGRGIEIHGVLLIIPHHQIARRKKVIYSTAIAAVGYVQALLKVGGAERKGETVLVAAQVEIHAEGYSCWQVDEGCLPFGDGDLNEIALVFGLVDGDIALVWE